MENDFLTGSAYDSISNYWEGHALESVGQGALSSNPCLASVQVLGYPREWELPTVQSHYNPEPSVPLGDCLVTSPSNSQDVDYMNDEFITDMISKMSSGEELFKGFKSDTEGVMGNEQFAVGVSPDETSCILNQESPVIAPVAEGNALEPTPISPQDACGSSDQSFKPKHPRKSRLVPRLTSNSQIGELIDTNINDRIKIDANAEFKVPIKQEPGVYEETTRNRRKRANAAASATTTIATASTASEQKVFAQYPNPNLLLEVPSNGKKPKMYQKVDDPKCRNAYIARLNREKKKLEFVALQSEHEKTMAENTELKRENDALLAEIEQHRLLTNSFVGLQRLGPSVANMMETIMMPLQEKSGQWQIRTPHWFGKVPAANVLDPNASHPSLSESCDRASKYITLYMNPIDRIVQMDYNPIEPNVLNNETPS